MKTFIKDEDKWSEEKDKQKILDAKEGSYVFAETMEDAVLFINTHLNPLYPNFNIVEVYNNWSYGSKIPQSIKVSGAPKLRHAVHFKDGIQLIEEHKTVESNNADQLRITWEKQCGKSLLEFGIVTDYSRFRYSPEEAKRELKLQKRRQNYKPRPRKNFIRMHEIAHVNYNMQSLISTSIKNLSGYIRFEMSSGYTSNLKIHECHKFLVLINLMNDMFGKYGYRQINTFQEFKTKWKGRKIKSTKSAGVSEDFFEFMQVEITRRKPKKRTLVSKWTFKTT